MILLQCAQTREVTTAVYEKLAAGQRPKWSQPNSTLTRPRNPRFFPFPCQLSVTSSGLISRGGSAEDVVPLRKRAWRQAWVGRRRQRPAGREDGVTCRPRLAASRSYAPLLHRSRSTEENACGGSHWRPSTWRRTPTTCATIWGRSSVASASPSTQMRETT